MRPKVGRAFIFALAVFCGCLGVDRCPSYQLVSPAQGLLVEASKSACSSAAARSPSPGAAAAAAAASAKPGRLRSSAPPPAEAERSKALRPQSQGSVQAAAATHAWGAGASPRARKQPLPGTAPSGAQPVDSASEESRGSRAAASSSFSGSHGSGRLASFVICPPADGAARISKCRCLRSCAKQTNAPGAFCSALCSQRHSAERETTKQQQGEPETDAKGGKDGAAGRPDIAAAKRQLVKDWVEEIIRRHKVVIFAKSYCPYCQDALEILRDVESKDVRAVMIDKLPEMDVIQDALEEMTGARTVPRVFIGGAFFGGCSDLENADEDGTLVRILKLAGAL
ncbi:putative glutaredoxin [Besnoitia besnoiti]|uniref:Putative glutaredoxin n=1 Tax=Besnoitia besnoiti TaxID=94643 RepID=A0A2A9MB00_BESBE|nr:putative glutaredoxin [Besnoitia besnoiti]PFH35059.1 putative glutaredoxin [Besnoitia besnoiti]